MVKSDGDVLGEISTAVKAKNFMPAAELLTAHVVSASSGLGNDFAVMRTIVCAQLALAITSRTNPLRDEAVRLYTGLCFLDESAFRSGISIVSLGSELSDPRVFIRDISLIELGRSVYQNVDSRLHALQKEGSPYSAGLLQIQGFRILPLSVYWADTSFAVATDLKAQMTESKPKSVSAESSEEEHVETIDSLFEDKWPVSRELVLAKVEEIVAARRKENEPKVSTLLGRFEENNFTGVLARISDFTQMEVARSLGLRAAHSLGCAALVLEVLPLANTAISKTPRGPEEEAAWQSLILKLGFYRTACFGPIVSVINLSITVDGNPNLSLFAGVEQLGSSSDELYGSLAALEPASRPVLEQLIEVARPLSGPKGAVRKVLVFLAMIRLFPTDPTVVSIIRESYEQLQKDLQFQQQSQVNGQLGYAMDLSKARAELNAFVNP